MDRNDLAKNVARDFWENRIDYPQFGAKVRRFFEVNYLVPQLAEYSSIVDVGCGSGVQLGLLYELIGFEKMLGLDLSVNLLKKVRVEIPTMVYDFYEIYEQGRLPDFSQFDVALFSGSIQYIMDSDTLQKVFSEINANIIFVRTTCTSGDDDELINLHSEELGADYSCLYRTLPNTLLELNKQFNIEHVRRVYPDEFESKFGTKQWWIKAKRK